MADSYTLGYHCGRLVRKVFIWDSGAKMAVEVVKIADKISIAHKIDATNPVAVTQNVFDCLEFVDW